MAASAERTWDVPLLERRQLSAPELTISDRAVETWVVNDGDVLHGADDGRARWLWSPGFATFSFTGAGPVAFDAAPGREAAARDFWIRSALPLAVQSRGTQVLHASALAGPNGVIAICGRTTAGKSTLVAAAQSSGLRAVGDDALAFEPGEGKLNALTLPFQIRLRPNAAAHMRLEGDAAAGSGGEVLPLALVILIDRETDATRPELSPVSPAEAVGALMPHAYCFSLAGKNELFTAYADLAERVPVVRVGFRRELDALPEVVEAIRALAD
jgi:hypothetical protein